MKKRLVVFGLMFLILFSYTAFSQSKEIPDWVKRVEFSGEWETNKHPTFYFQTVQPLYQTTDKVDTIFIQPRMSLRAGDLTYNLGVGYRKIVSSDLLLGVNLFGDYQDLREHGRLGHRLCV